MKTRPLNRSITIICVTFFFLLCVILSAATWFIYTTTLYTRYQKQMASIVDYVEAHIDTDDMAQCAKTYEESEKYKETQAFFDDFIDHYPDVHYLYIMQVLNPAANIKVREICAANSTYEKENEPEMVLHLGDGEEGWYDTETARKIRQYQMGSKDVYFLNPSQWGVDYTLARPLVDSTGWHYALLCVDIDVADLNQAIYRNIYVNIGVIVLAGIFFILLLIFRMRRSVILPLRQLEKSVSDFLVSSEGTLDPDQLQYHAPQLNVHNEVQSLSAAMTKLSEDMRAYIKQIAAARDETKGLQTQVFVDPLTKVKNKAAYDEAVRALTVDIVMSRAEFGLVMVDLNNLKTINDRYGHDHGNDYITGACRFICEVFCHSPVYRVGGDEFVVVLRGEDYRQRDRLCADLRERYAACIRNAAADPWERYSAAVGMSVYQPDDTVESVFDRADQAMYSEKTRMKGGR